MLQGIAGAGVRRGGECFCFASGLPDEDKLIYVRDEQCREPCKGDPTFFCGGTTAVHIYVASKRKFIERKYISLSPDQLVQLGGSDLGTAATRRPHCLVRNRKLKIFALNRADTSSCRSRRKSGIGSFMFSSEGNHIVLETFISLPFKY